MVLKQVQCFKREGGFWGRLGVFILIVIVAQSSLAAPQFTATLSADRVRPGDRVELQLEVKTEEEVSVDIPKWKIPDAVTNLGVQTRTALESRLIPGPNGMQFQKSRSVVFVYQLQAKEKGTVALGPFSLKVEGRDLTAGALRLQVTPSAPSPRENRNRLGSLLPPGLSEEEEALFGGFFGQQPPQQEPPVVSKKLPVDEKELFFVVLETDKKEVFEGEQIFASWYLYTRGQIHQFDRLKFPELKGFWKEDVEPAPNLNFEKEMVNGVLFQRALLASYAIFPIKAGKAVIDEYKVRAMVSLGNPFGGFGLSQPENYTRLSQPLTVDVKALPQQGRPDNFVGAVGQFKVEAHVDQQRFVQGQPFTVKLRFEGDGNAKLIELPQLTWPSDFELYDSKSESRFFQSGKSYKEFTLLLIPKSSGVLRLPPFRFSYFDPSDATYKPMETQEIALQVEAGVNLPQDSSRLQTPTAPPPKELSTILPPPDTALSNPTWHWLFGLPMLFVWTSLYSALFLLFILGHWIWLRRLYRSRTLWDELSERKQIWEKDFSKNQFPQGSVEIINSIYFVLSRLIDQGGFNKDLQQLLDLLPPSIRGEVSASLRKQLDLFQTVAFAPKAAWENSFDGPTLKKEALATYQLLQKTLELSEEGPLA